jgi:hypothetical protein
MAPAMSSMKASSSCFLLLQQALILDGGGGSDGARLQRQALQWFGHAPRQPPGQGHREQHQRQGDQTAALHGGPRRRLQLVLGHLGQQVQPQAQRHLGAQPVRRTSGQRGGVVGACGIGAVGADQLALVAEQSQAVPGRQSLGLQLSCQGVQQQVGGQHQLGRVQRGLGQRDAGPLRGEEAVDRRAHQLPLGLGHAVPGAGARIEARRVVGVLARDQGVQLGVEQAGARRATRLVDVLTDELRLRRRRESLAQTGVEQPAQDVEAPLAVGDEHRGQLRLQFEQAAQHFA